MKLILLLALKSYTQNLPNPLDQGTNALNGLTGDFGPRFYVGSAWHFGLDYGRTTYGEAYAVEAANSISFNSLDKDYAFIKAGNWRYMHVFVGQTPDSLWHLKTDENILIIRERNANGKLMTKRIYVPSTFNPLTCLDSGTMQTVKVTRTVAQGDLIFRARDYGTTGSQGDHLHLDRDNGSFEHPLSYLARTDGNNMSATFDFKYINNNKAVAFVNNILYGDKIIIESDIDYHVERDFNILEVEISKDGRNYDQLYRWAYTGPDHLDLRLIDMLPGTSRTPQHNIRMPGTGTVTDIQNDIREGIFPVATGAQSRDIFKFYWNSRDTLQGKGYKYTDGDYTFRVSAYDLNNHKVTLSKSKTVDNFRPYIKDIYIINGGACRKFESHWKMAATGNTLERTGLTNPLNVKKTVAITVTTSEPMSYLNVFVKSTGVKGTQTGGTNGNTIWSFKFNSADLPQTGNSIELQFTGKDMNGNFLTDMPEDVASLNALTDMPVRTGNGFSATGRDFNENVTLSMGTTTVKSGTESCTDGNGTAQPPVAQYTYARGANNVVTFTNTSQNAAASQIFIDTDDAVDFGVAGTTCQRTFPVLEYTTTYDVTLVAVNADGVTSYLTSKVVIPGTAAGEPCTGNASSTPVVAAFTMATGISGGTLGTVKFTNTSTGPVYSYQWDFGDGSPVSEEVSPAHQYEPGKYYTPSLTALSCSDSKIKKESAGICIVPYIKKVTVSNATSGIVYSGYSRNITGTKLTVVANGSPVKIPKNTPLKVKIEMEGTVDWAKLAVRDVSGNDEFSATGVFVSADNSYEFSIDAGKLKGGYKKLAFTGRFTIDKNEYPVTSPDPLASERAGHDILNLATIDLSNYPVRLNTWNITNWSIVTGADDNYSIVVDDPAYATRPMEVNLLMDCNNNSYKAVLYNYSNATCTVDFGDGTSGSIAANGTVEHSYVFSAASATYLIKLKDASGQVLCTRKIFISK